MLPPPPPRREETCRPKRSWTTFHNSETVQKGQDCTKLPNKINFVWKIDQKPCMQGSLISLWNQKFQNPAKYKALVWMHTADKHIIKFLRKADQPLWFETLTKYVCRNMARDGRAPVQEGYRYCVITHLTALLRLETQPHKFWGYVCSLQDNMDSIWRWCLPLGTV